MPDIKELQQERTSIFYDVYDNKIPKRVPVNINLAFEAVAQFGGLDLKEAQWKPRTIEKAANDLCEKLFSDICPAATFSLRFPALYEILQSQSFVMGSNGFMQHPEVVGMLAEDYDYLIEKPWECLLERVIPRQFKSFNLSDPVAMTLKFAAAFSAYNADIMESVSIGAALTQKYGYYPGNALGNGSTEAPFDYLADQLRSFTKIIGDTRRIPEKVIEACEALYPILLKKGMPAIVNQYSRVMYPLHMPTFLNEKTFETMWWPSFSKLCNEYASMGVSNNLWCEDNWMRYLDYLYELPTNTQLMFEYGDAKPIKEKLGKKHIITGLYPITLLKTGTKQQCIDKAKELIDTLAPGGKYIFGLDKVIITNDSINLDNLAAVTEYVRDHAVYSNAGESAGMEYRKEDYKTAPRRQLESSYYDTSASYMAKHPDVPDYGAAKLQSIDDRIFNILAALLI